MSIAELYSDAGKARDALEHFIALLSQAKYDTARHRPALDGQSLSGLVTRAFAFFECLDTIRPTDDGDGNAVAAGARVPELRGHLQVLYNNLHATTSQLKAHWRDDLRINDLGENFNWQLTADGGPIATTDVTQQLQTANQSINYLTSTIGSLLPLARTVGVADLTARAEAAALLVRSLEAFRTEAQKTTKAVDKHSQAVSAAEASSRDLLARSETILSSMTASQVQATTSLGEVTALIEKIRATGSAAGTLEEIVQTYQSKFEAFQKALTERTAAFMKFEADSSEATKANEKRESEVDRLMNLADSMISGATTAGLAKSMEDTRARYESRMLGARLGFYVAVGLLVLSALPLFVHLVPGLAPAWLGEQFGASGSIAPDAASGLLARVLLLLPATWLTAFFARAYADFFHLEREYAHKAALAMSVDGFKRQAPGYEQEITAEVFSEILVNPGRGKPVEPANHPLVGVLDNVLKRAKPQSKD